MRNKVYILINSLGMGIAMALLGDKYGTVVVQI